MSTDWKEIALAPDEGAFLCDITDIPDGGGLEVVFGEGKEPFRVLLLRRNERVWAYQNSCPHFSIPLNFDPQHFIVLDSELVMCAHHSAFFTFDDGLCVDGPCAGARLLSIPIRIAEGRITIAA